MIIRYPISVLAKKKQKKYEFEMKNKKKSQAGATYVHIFTCPEAPPLTYIAFGSMSTIFFSQAETFFLDVLDMWE